MSFSSDTAVRPAGDGEFRADIRTRWWVVRGPNGGYVAAIILRAMQARLADDPTRTPRSFTVHYLDPPQEGEVRIATTVERAGRALTTITARMTQGGRPVALALAAFSRPRPSLEFNDLPMPEVPPPSELQQRAFDPEVMPPMAGRMAVWHALGALPMSGQDEPLTGGWMRLDESEPLDFPQLALLCDAWMPAVFNRMTGFGGAPTIDLTVHFRQPIPAGVAADDVYLGVFRTNVGSEGFVEQDGDIWTADGRLLAQCRQLQIALLP